MKPIALMLSLFFCHAGFSQSGTVGIFQHQTDIGAPALKGSAYYDDSTQTYTITGAGYNIWFERDEFQYLYNELEGDFILTANFAFEDTDANPHRKIGWMIRESTDAAAAHAGAVLHGDGLTVLQWRELRGAFMRDPEDEIFAPKSNYEIIQLERSGREITMRAAHPGEPLQLIGSHQMETLTGKVLAGLFICAHDPKVLEQAKVWNVRVDQPAPEGYNPGRDGYLGCRLETMDVFTGRRNVIYEKDSRFEAPNWMPDGRQLLFNMDGGLYKIPVEGGEPVQLNTGSAQRNNNDHGISFDGKLLAISSSRSDLPGGSSAVHILPLEGGEPTLVTDQTPSYWHGWAPNNEEVVYVARRAGSERYNIYRKNIKGGAEVALTDTKAGEHVDGCEYSPDGQYIYYNGSHSGTMQIWRMKPDGSGKEQITFDETNDWFPHISPDGKWMVYISFPPTIPVNAHPAYQRVVLKLMPLSGGPAKVITHLYGGQGTINVPSWSPDSRQIAFVSNSGK